MTIHQRVLLLAVMVAIGSYDASARGQVKPAGLAGGERPMLSTAKLMAFVATSDAARSKEFYAKTLGLRLIADESFALVFDANGTQLRIQKVQKTQPPSFTVLGWEVANIAESVRAFRAQGLTFERFGFFKQDDLGVWTADDGTKVAWFKDPDGNVLSLTQFAR